ncbi:STARD3 N-terminal-like protein isoform X2 [Scyliorhinus canicula]|uniref:STARD3 N-terminal-like protein isoform X2 n=1 Tax=Scyliorhinus canicula TaxID=7830 RepID=UPI0018F4FABC|nr:STARD3 N-terminal-like protein isoform X2 [Scyliorhinus canicula]
MSRLLNDQDNARVNRFSSSASVSTTHSVNTSQLAARLQPYSNKKTISDVRRTFCLFVTFDLLFVGLLWIIELNVDGGIIHSLESEVIHYDFHKSYFDIFLLAVFRFLTLVIAYALCRLNHWWVIAITTAVTSAFLIVKVIVSKLLVQGTAFAYLLPIISFILAWIETWFLDFKVLPQELKDENRVLQYLTHQNKHPSSFLVPSLMASFILLPNRLLILMRKMTLRIQNINRFLCLRSNKALI